MINCLLSGFSHSSEKLVNMNKYIAATGGDTDLVFVVRTDGLISPYIIYSMYFGPPVVFHFATLQPS